MTIIGECVWEFFSLFFFFIRSWMHANFAQSMTIPTGHKSNLFVQCSYMLVVLYFKVHRNFTAWDHKTGVWTSRFYGKVLATCIPLPLLPMLSSLCINFIHSRDVHCKAVVAVYTVQGRRENRFSVSCAVPFQMHAPYPASNYEVWQGGDVQIMQSTSATCDYWKHKRW